MPRGGARRGAGRKKGKTRAEKAAIRERSDSALLSGETPLEYMLRVMRDQTDQSPAGHHRRDEMARASAAFCHPKLQNVDVEATLNFDWSKVPIDQIKQIERAFSVAAGEPSVFADERQGEGSSRPEGRPRRSNRKG